MARTRDEIKQSLLDHGGSGDEYISQAISPELDEYRKLLRQRLASQRTRTFTYANPDNIPYTPPTPPATQLPPVPPLPGGYGAIGPNFGSWWSALTPEQQEEYVARIQGRQG